MSHTQPTEPLPEVPGAEAAEEPLLTRATIVALVTAVLGALVAFNVDLTEKQTAAVIVLAGVLSPFVVAWAGRSSVFAPRTVRKMVQAAREGKL